GGNNIEAVCHGTARLPPGRIDHVNVKVRDLERSAGLYEAVLGALGVRRVTYATAGFGAGGMHVFLDEGEPSQDVHLAFAADDNEAVDAFWRSGLANGATGNGEPGERDYHPGYYG